MFQRLTVAVLLLTILFLPAAGTQAQEGDDIDVLLQAAIAFLGEQRGTTITLAEISNWSWQEQLWPDASLGCPVAGQEYPEEPTRGYIFRLTYNQSLYEIHITPDGASAVFCGSQAAPPPSPVPEDAAATATPLPDAQPAATPLPLDEPEQLVNIALAYLSSQLNTAITRTSISRWTYEETVWPDTSLGCPVVDGIYDDTVPVRGYAIVIEYVDQVYELHMTPDGRTIMPCGENPALNPVVDGAFSGIVAEPMPTATLPPAAEAAAPPAESGGVIVLYTGPDGNVFHGTLSTLPGDPITSDTPALEATPAALPRFDHIYSAYRWSPDGQYAAFVDSAAPARLLVTDASGSTPVQIETGGELARAYPPAWSPDGLAIAYVRPTQTFRANNQVMDVYAVPRPGEEAAAPRLLTTFEQATGCGGGSGDPADTVYTREAGFMGNALALEWLDTNTLVISPSCSGVGLARLDIPSGELTMIDAELSRAALSPDGTQAAGLVMDSSQNPQLVLVDLATGEREPLGIEDAPDQVAWSADGSMLYVSTLTLAERVPRAGVEESIAVYTVRLWGLDPVSGESALFFEQEGRGVGRMVDTSSGLLFTFVEDARAWLAAVEGGQSVDAQREAAPGSWMLLLTPDGQIARLGRGGQPAALSLQG